MDAFDPDEPAEDGDEDLARLLRALEATLRTAALPPCRACKGTGMCITCRGHGRYYIRDLGGFTCKVCGGDGACRSCQRTGKELEA